MEREYHKPYPGQYPGAQIQNCPDCGTGLLARYCHDCNLVVCICKGDRCPAEEQRIKEENEAEYLDSISREDDYPDAY